MTPTGPEIAAGLRGAWLLLRLDASGMRYFDDSLAGFWKSFYAAVLSAPGYLIIVMLHLSDVELTGGFFHLVLVQAFSYAISWLAFPLAVFYIAEIMGSSAHFIAFVVALNWSKVIQLCLYLPVMLLVWAGFLTDQIAALLSFAVTVAVLGYQWFVTRTALAVGGFIAAFLVAVDLVISLIVTSIADRMVT